MNPRVAITGASGFLGRHLVDAFVKRGLAVVAASRHPLPHASPLVTPLEMDIGDPGRDPLSRLGSPDILVHLAWSGLPNYRSDHHLRDELPRQIRFLDACIDDGLASLLVAGTCLEYGNQAGKLAESMPGRADTCYGQAKLALLGHLASRSQDIGFRLTWARLFYLFGTGQARTSLYSQLMTAIDSGAAEFDMSPGDQLRDFLPVQVAAEHLAGLALHHAGAGIVNVCSGTPVSVTDIVHSWMAARGHPLRLNKGVYAYTDYEPFAFWGSPEKLHSLLGTP